MASNPANPADAMRQLTRFARQLREYVKETADEVTPYIEHSLAEYVAESIERVGREDVTMDKALGLALAKEGRAGQERQGERSRRPQKAAAFDFQCYATTVSTAAGPMGCRPSCHRLQRKLAAVAEALP